ncbi:MAG: hypothetical protein IH899_00820 [Planctomycetes bacterium]|nr:hypothetical protein [Planctomycetota bacterium]
MTHTNLLPLDFRRWLLVKIRLLQWSLVWGLSLLALVALWAAKSVDRHTQTRQLQTLERQCDPLREMNEDNNRVRERLAELEQRQSLLADLDTVQYPLLLVGIVSQGTHRSHSRVQVRDFSLAPVTPVSAKSTKSASQVKNKNNEKQTEEYVSARMRLTLKGIALDDLAVAQFIVALRDTGVFNAVELKSSLVTQLAGGPAREYFVECTY